MTGHPIRGDSVALSLVIDMPSPIGEWPSLARDAIGFAKYCMLLSFVVVVAVAVVLLILLLLLLFHCFYLTLCLLYYFYFYFYN